MKAPPEKEKKPYDPYLLEKIEPKGGISFKPIDYIRTGTGFETCLNVYDFPAELSENWMTTLCAIEGATTIIDLHTEEKNTVKANMKKALGEQNSRLRLATKSDSAMDASMRLQELQLLYEEVMRMGEVVKYVQVRIFLVAETLTKLRDKVAQVQADLAADDYKAAGFLNEQKWEWQSMFEPYQKQQKRFNARHGQPLTSQAIAGGNPYHFSSLDDPNGLYLATTPSGGTVNYNQFTKTKSRNSYCGVILASQGSGKSTLLKKLETHCHITGGFVRAIDPMDEHYGICDANGGAVLAMDGTAGIINMFEIYMSGETQAVSYMRHIKRLRTEYNCLNSDVSGDELKYFETVVRAFYMDFGILPKDPEQYNATQIAGRPSIEYPICSDFVSFLQNKINTIVTPDDPAKAAVVIDEMRYLQSILRTFENLMANYGSIVDGHTSIPDIMNVPFVAFHTKNIHQFSPEVVDLLILNILYLCWDNCIQPGIKQKILWEQGKLAWEDISPFLITWDEFHRVLSSRKLTTLYLIQEMLREMRHYFAGILLVSQSVREFDPQDNSEAAGLIRGIFELCQYKWIGRQDAGATDVLRKLFQNTLTDSEYDRIKELEQSQFIMGISGSHNLEIQVFASDEEIKTFKGGA